MAKHVAVPKFLATLYASSGDMAAMLFGVGMPYFSVVDEHHELEWKWEAILQS
jgi:hypothetical protein